MKISIIHPSRGRPEQAINTAIHWFAMADNDIEYLLVLDKDDYKSYTPLYQILYQANKGFWVPEPKDNKNCVEAVNYGASLVDSDIIIVVSDDMECPLHWDTLLLDAIGNRTDFCAKTIDGHQYWLITLPILDRVYYERFGYVYHPDYVHMYADLDMTCVAWMLDRCIKLPLEFKHNHPVVTHKPLDAINIRNNESWGQGKAKFIERMLSGFGIEQINPLPMDELRKQGLAI